MIYLFPFIYTLHSRYKTLPYKIAFLIVYIIPLLICGTYFGSDIRLFLLSILGLSILYELGYIHNDIFTVKKEKQPTQRISAETLQSIEDNYVLIADFHIIEYLVIATVYYTNFPKYLCSYLFGGIFITAAYSAHNSIRSRWNILTFLILVILKYFVPLSCFIRENHMLFEAFVSVAILICLPRSIEYAGKSLNCEWLLSKTAFLRFVYYTLMLGTGGLYAIIEKKQSLFFLLSLYYWLFRGGCFIWADIKHKLALKEKETKK